MNQINLFESTTESEHQDNLTVVRVATSAWENNKGIHQKKSLIWVKRLCRGENALQTDVDAATCEDVISRVVNLNDCPDGLYRVVLCNISRDRETGYIDSFDYRLWPYKPPGLQ